MKYFYLFIVLMFSATSYVHAETNADTGDEDGCSKEEGFKKFLCEAMEAGVEELEDYNDAQKYPAKSIEV